MSDLYAGNKSLSYESRLKLIGQNIEQMLRMIIHGGADDGDANDAALLRRDPRYLAERRPLLRAEEVGKGRHCIFSKGCWH